MAHQVFRFSIFLAHLVRGPADIFFYKKMWTPLAAAIKAAALMPAMLAWSVHAADEAVRQKLVPTTAHSMLELRDAYLKARILKSFCYFSLYLILFVDQR